MYDETKQYVTKDSYFEFSGIDLDIEIKSGQYDNPTLATETFIKNTQTEFYELIRANYEITLWDDDIFAKALLWQIKHILKHGEESGINKTAYRIMHENAMINPQQDHRYYRRW